MKNLLANNHLKMGIRKKLGILILVLLSTLTVHSQSVVINRVFKGTEGEGSTTRGRYDAIELLVIEDHVDMRNWIIKDYSSAVVSGLSGDGGGKFRFKDVALWKDLRSGTTITLRQPGNPFTNNPSPNPDYVEDTDASDLKIDINIRNKDYLRTLVSPSNAEASTYIDRTFMLNDGSELVLLRWDDGTGDGMGSANTVHAFGYGSLGNSSHYTGVTAPKLYIANAPAKGAYLYALSTNKNITDYATVAGVSKSKDPLPYNPVYGNNSSLAEKIQNGTSLIKSITSEIIVNNYPGVKEAYITYVNQSDQTTKLYILEVDLSDPKLSIEVGTVNNSETLGGTQTVFNMIPYKNDASFKKEVIAAVNGDYFAFETGLPTGTVIKDAKYLQDKSSSNYYYFAQLDNKSYSIGGIVEYDRLKQRMNEAIGAKYWIVKNSVIQDVADNAAPARTSIGLTTDNKAIFLVVDNKAGVSTGLSLQNLGNVMKSLGATEALNLDGGGSSTFITKETNGTYQVKNSPTDGSQRRVSNALFLMRKTD